VDSPQNEEIVIALREIAAGKVSIKEKESERQEEKRTVEMAKTHRGRITEETETAARKTSLKRPASKKETATSVGIEKEYLKSRKVCKVRFVLPKIAATDAKSVSIVGDFNDWDTHANPMRKLGDGNYAVTLELEPGREYQFRYFVNESKWENDWNADKYVKSPYGDSDNSVVMV
jgi:1,4-alpha-glucan branching enzyme